MSRGIKMEPNEGVVATVPQSDDLVKLGKRKAWAKFLAYEVIRCHLSLVANPRQQKLLTCACCLQRQILPGTQAMPLPACLQTC